MLSAAGGDRAVPARPKFGFGPEEVKCFLTQFGGKGGPGHRSPLVTPLLDPGHVPWRPAAQPGILQPEMKSSRVG